MLERYRDVMNQIHMPDDCDWKIRSAMEKKARETHRRLPLRRISLAAAVVAILVTTALAATFLRSQTFQEMLGREAVQWEDQIQEGVLAELTMDHFRVQVVQSLFYHRQRQRGSGNHASWMRRGRQGWRRWICSMT